MLLGLKSKAGYTHLPSSAADVKRAGRAAKDLIAAAERRSLADIPANSVEVARDGVPEQDRLMIDVNVLGHSDHAGSAHLGSLSPRADGIIERALWEHWLRSTQLVNTVGALDDAELVPFWVGHHKPLMIVLAPDFPVPRSAQLAESLHFSL